MSAVVAALDLFRRRRPSAEAASKNKFLIASDIHFNPMADPALVAELAAADPSQWETILQRTQPTAFSLYGQDTNWWLLQSALDQMRKTLAPSRLRDVSTGTCWRTAFPRPIATPPTTSDPRTLPGLCAARRSSSWPSSFARRFPDTKILLTPGNNDEDCGDYSIRAGGTFLSDTAELARDLAGADEAFAADWKALGSYNVPHPTIPGVRILSLNTVFFSNNYHATSFSEACATVPSTAASDLLAWLESNLAAARQANQKVVADVPYPSRHRRLRDHQNRAARSEATCPIGGESCANAIVPDVGARPGRRGSMGCWRHFRTPSIASFAGHTHSDDFRLINTAGVNKAFVLIDPAISPIYDQNPSFRIVHVRRRRLTGRSDHLLSDKSQAGQQQGPRTVEEGVQLLRGSGEAGGWT